MTKVLAWIKTRLIDHWQSTLAGVLLYIGFIWFRKGKLEFSEFTTYIALIPTIILLLMKNFSAQKDS